MAKKEEPEFTITDRRKFTLEGEARSEGQPETQEETQPAPPPPSTAAPPAAPPPPQQQPQPSHPNEPTPGPPHSPSFGEGGDRTPGSSGAPPSHPNEPTPGSSGAPPSHPNEPTPGSSGAPPPGPSAAQRAQGHAAYKQSAANLEQELTKELGAEASRDFQADFEHVLEPFYVTALMQLGMMGQEGTERRVDIVGARQTIDTVSLLHDKTKGNLTPEEETIFQTMLYQLRMAYVEVTNALSRAAQAPKGPGPAKQ